MKREEKSVIQRFLVVLMVGMLLVTPSQGEADSSSTGSQSQSARSQKKSTPEVARCMNVGIGGSALDLPQDVLLGIRQNQNAPDLRTASLFYRLLKYVSLVPGQRVVSFLVGYDGLPIEAFSESDCGANPGSGNGGNQAEIDPIEF